MGQVILLSLTASLNPTLVAATTLMLLLPSPSKLMLGYLLGALMTRITLGFVMLWMLEVPLASFLLAPDWTPGAVERAKGWIRRHAHVFAVRGFAGVGGLLVLKGLIGLIS